jgi:hypothetical protein
VSPRNEVEGPAAPQEEVEGLVSEIKTSVDDDIVGCISWLAESDAVGISCILHRMSW